MTSPPPSLLARRHLPVHLASEPVHQAGWHWEHRVLLSYPNVTLPHDWHMDPKRILVPPGALAATVGEAGGRGGGGLPWAGPAPTLVDFTDPNYDEKDA
ncbi:hypothetical protein D1007_35646 [Hordeum vulgare]|nr:hypothetical protein D1007_35646 [Hordeum vulgare]